jgi:hypothetical protein
LAYSHSPPPQNTFKSLVKLCKSLFPLSCHATDDGPQNSSYLSSGIVAPRSKAMSWHFLAEADKHKIVDHHWDEHGPARLICILSDTAEREPCWCQNYRYILHVKLAKHHKLLSANIFINLYLVNFSDTLINLKQRNTFRLILNLLHILGSSLCYISGVLARLLELRNLFESTLP